jgi:uncharacterized protein
MSRLWITAAAALSVTAVVIAGLFVLIKLHDGKPTVSEQMSTAPSLFPELTGRVVDEASILSENDTIELATKLKAIEDKNTDQVVVVTVLSLRGYSIDEYANRLGNHWAVGTREKNNGVLLVVAPNERKVRIEVGRGLEHILTDEIAKEIIDKNILPSFREGDYAGGIRDGVNAVLLVLGSS